MRVVWLLLSSRTRDDSARYPSLGQQQPQLPVGINLPGFPAGLIAYADIVVDMPRTAYRAADVLGEEQSVLVVGDALLLLIKDGVSSQQAAP